MNIGAASNGMSFVVTLVLIVIAFAFMLIGGQFPRLDNSKVGKPVVIATPVFKDSKTSLQLYTFSGLTVTPTLAQTPVTTPTIPPTGNSCEPGGGYSSLADIISIIDASGSMGGIDIPGIPGIGIIGENKLKAAKDAAKKFVDIISVDSNNKVGVVSYGSSAILENPLTNDYALIKNKIDAIKLQGVTCIQCGINQANQEFSANGRSNSKRIAILLTDGQANETEAGEQAGPKPAAINAVKNMLAVNNVAIYTIGLGSSIDASFLQEIANLTGGKYYFSPTSDELQEIYEEIAQKVIKGLISGFIFNDTNGNGAFDINETKLSGWNVQLISSGGTTTFTTDAAGEYAISGLCDGNYQLKEILQSGWQQTLPTDPNGYSITITNGNSFTDKNFGNHQ